MHRFRVSMGQLIIIAAVLAVDCAVIRSLLRVTPGSNQIAYFVMVDPTHSITVLALALGVLPMGTLLVPATMAELLAIRRGNAATSRRSGFVACGWLVVAAYITLAALSPPAIGRYINAVGQLLGPILTPPLIALFGPNLERLSGWPVGGTILIEALEATPALVGLFGPELILTRIGVRLLRRPTARRGTWGAEDLGADRAPHRGPSRPPSGSSIA
jgi:hypothetical protein